MQALWYWGCGSDDWDSDYRAGNIYSVDTLGKAMVHVLSYALGNTIQSLRTY